MSLEGGQPDQEKVLEDRMVHYARELERALGGEYRNIRFAGQQNSGIVFFRARKSDIDTEVLMKVAFGHFCSGKRKEFLAREAAILGKLPLGSMPVVLIYNFFPDLRVNYDPEAIKWMEETYGISGEDQCAASCLVMKDIQGISLAELMKYLREHPSKQIVSDYLAAGIGHWLGTANAILHGNYRCLAHSNEQFPPTGHGDISAANVQLAISYDSAMPVLIDFGTACPLDSFAPDGATLFYISPERLSYQWSARSEIFSLAVLIYQLCTGRHPYGGMKYIPFLWEDFRDNPQKKLPEPDMLSHFNSEFADILRSALSIDPDKRPHTMADFAYALWQIYARGSDIHGNLPFELDRYLQSIGIVDTNRVQSIRGKLAADTAKIISVP